MKRSLLSAGIARALFAAPLLMCLGAGTALAQNSDEDTDESEPERLERIEVTGSRIKRVDIEGPAPVTIITRDQIDREGLTTVFDVLNTLTQAGGVTQNDMTQSGFTPNANVVNLRSLGPGRVLTLINGRRAADYPLPYNGQSNFVNLGSIPAAAVERIEVLAGGASAIYGSDAVAGVINIVLRTNFDGDHFTGRVGTTSQGGGDSLDLQWSGGRTGDNWSLTYALQSYHREPIYAFQRDFMDSYRDDPTTENPIALASIRIRDRTRTTDNYILPGGPDVCGRFSEFEPFTYVTAAGANLGPACAFYTYPAFQSIRNSDNNLSGYVYGTWAFENGMEAWASLNVWTSKATVSSGVEFWTSGLIFDQDLNTTIDIQRIFDPQETGGVDGLDRNFDEESYDTAVGLRGVVFDRFDWDFTLSRSYYESINTRPRLLLGPVTDYFLGPRLGTTSGGRAIYRTNMANLLNPLTPETYRNISTQVRTHGESSSDQLSFVISGDLWEMPAGPLGVAGTLEYGSQEYTLDPDDRILPGRNIVYNLTGTGGGGERDRYAAGVEFKVPLLTSLTASAAGRYDKYDDVTRVDDSLTYNLGLEWRPTDNLLARASRATSFRAPDMHYVFAEGSGSFISIFDEYACRATGSTVAECGVQNPAYNYGIFSQRQGSTALEEEKGDSFTGGFVWDVLDSLSLSVDYYKIELKGSVADISSTYILQNEANCRLGVFRDGTPFTSSLDSLFCQDILSRVSRITGTGTTDDGDIEEVTAGPINRAFLSTDGIDAALNFSHDTDRYGSFAYQLGWSHTLSDERAEFSDQEPDDIRNQLNNLAFRSRIRGSVTWQNRDWSATIFGLRYGSLPDWSETGARLGSYRLYNTTVRYAFSENLSASLIVNNVLNTRPTNDDTFFDWPYFWRAYDYIGREVFLQADYRF